MKTNDPIHTNSKTDPHNAASGSMYTDVPATPTENPADREAAFANLFLALAEPSQADLAICGRAKAQLLEAYDQLAQFETEPLVRLTRLERLLFQYPWRVLLPLSCITSLVMSLLVDNLFVNMVNLFRNLGG